MLYWFFGFVAKLAVSMSSLISMPQTALRPIGQLFKADENGQLPRIGRPPHTSWHPGVSQSGPIDKETYNCLVLFAVE